MPPVANQFRMIEIKAVEGAEEGTFEGVLSSYGLIDTGGDLVEPGAYKKTIQDNKGQITLLWNHKQDEPIGVAELIDTPQALRLKGKLNLDVQRAREVHSLIKSGAVKATSIGYKPIQKEYKEGTRHLREVKLFEASCVCFPMDETALIQSVKSMDDGTSDFGDNVDAQQTCAMGYTLMGTLGDCLRQTWWAAGNDYDDDAAEDMPALLAYAEGCIDDFKAQYMAALAKYGAMMSDDSEAPDKAMRQAFRAKFRDMFEAKAGKTKRVAGEDLPSNAFLIVGDAQDTSTWKLPYKFSTDAKTKSHVRNALARIDQVQGVSAGELAAAKKKLTAVAKQYGIDGSDGKMLAEEPETKAGKTISSATSDSIKQAHAHVASAVGSMTLASTVLTSLIQPAAVSNDGYPTSTADEKSAEGEVEEPGDELSLDLKQQLLELSEMFAGVGK